MPYIMAPNWRALHCSQSTSRHKQEETTPNHLPFPTAPSLSRSTPPSPLSSPPSNHSTHSLPPRSNSASPSSPSSRPTSPKALISVTNDDDLAHMMHEYDRLFRTSSKPARLRLFLFPVNPPSPAQSFGSSEDRSDWKRFMEALNSGPVQSPPPPSAVAFAPSGNANFLFGSDKGMQLPFLDRIIEVHRCRCKFRRVKAGKSDGYRSLPD
ncbi:hypothetical protein RJ639_038626 [Escallonia herrerae]|uniref:PB1 domain-containing protein n=1 Tax=Escallonia herrerae TaxID=1293975 RepID=A0AA88WJ26_9ASTE|nr:hypothetical protein RJ639_038626 [Escallonia herrerae]